MKIKKEIINEYLIQENGIISIPEIGEGRMIPALILNSNIDSKLKELVKIHKDTESGDAICNWSKPFNQFFDSKEWYLDIEFSSPMKFNFHIKFILSEDYSLIDAIKEAKGVYIAYGLKGQKVSTLKEELILVEVNIIEDDNSWKKTLNKVLKKEFKKKGIGKKQIKKEVNERIKSMRKFTRLKRDQN